MTSKQERIILILMGINALMFLIIFLVVSSNYRFAADDYHMLVKTKELGVWKSMLFYFNNWNSRWSATLLTNFVLNSSSSPISFILYHLAALCFGFVAIWSFIKAFIKHLGLPFRKAQVALIALYLLGGVFYCSFSKTDTWFWITVNPMYLLGSFSAVLGGSFILQNWLRPIRLGMVFLLFLYAGGASETVAISTVVTLCFFGFISHKKKYLIQLDKAALHVATIGCLVGFGIDLYGAGTGIRYEHLPKFELQDKILIGLWNYLKFILKEIPLIMASVFICVSPFAYWGRKQLRFQLMHLTELFVSNRKLWALVDLLIIILAFALACSMGEMGPKRAWFPISISVFIAALAVSYQLGTWVYIKTNGRLFALVILGQLVAILYQGYAGTTQIIKTTLYAVAVDERMTVISNFTADESHVYELEPLPESGWLLSAEISVDTSHFTNRHLELFFENKYNLKLKDPKSPM